MSTRNVRPFVHLRVLSSYSLGHGLSTPADLCRHARRVGFDAVALTDVGGTHGLVEFHRAAREVGVKPIYGTLLVLDWGVAPASRDPVQTLILLALDRVGLRHVCAAATLSATRRERREPLTVADIEGCGDGVVAIAGFSAPADGPSPRHYLSALRGVFGDRVFVEYRDGLSGEPMEMQARVVADAADVGVPAVLVQDVRFVGPARQQLIDLVASASERAFEHRVFSDPRIGDSVPEHGMRTAAEMSAAYDAAPEAHSNAALIASLVQPDLLESLEVHEGPAHADMFDPSGEASRVLRGRVEAAFEERFGRRDDAKVRRAVVQDELAALERAGLAETIVQFADVVERLRRAGVVVGPATGLSLQSACAYLLGLTTFDPYLIDAAFRPDFEDTSATRVLDVQTTPEFRPRVLGTLNRVFDGAGIGYVPTVEHITAARALRIVAKRLEDIPPEVEDAIKVASRHHGVTLRELSEDNRSFGALYRKSAAFRDIVSHAAAIEGLPYGYARTKRSVIVSPKPLRAAFAFTVDPETGDRFVQATRDSFPVGDIRRVDVATLQVLAVVDDAGADTTELDRDALVLVARGDLDGVYLLEGAPGRLAATFGISTFADLVHFVALLRQRRTGTPLAERVATFRDEGRVVPAAKAVGDVLTSTYGVLLFEDQMRDVVARLTRQSAADASALAARFGDHAPGNLAALRREFFAYAVEAAVSFEDATAWFTRLLRHAHDVQNRQRVIAEALIVRRCLAAKARDRAAFFARFLDAPLDADKRARYRALLEQEGTWLAPSITASERGHAVEGERVRAPLWTIDGVTRDASDTIIRMRGAKKVTTAEEFRFAALNAGINLEVIDALIRAGAIDGAAGTGKEGTGRTRPVLSSVAASGQMNMVLSGTVPEGSTPPGPAFAQSPSAQKDGNSRHGFRVVPSLSEFYPHPSATPVELAGRIRNFHDFKTSSGKTVGFFELFDSSGSVRVFVPWERVARIGEPLSDGCRVTVKGKVRLRDGRKVCDALEIVVAEGGNGHGETSPDDPSKGDP
ncbi:MAG TPA: PHP domain-containing protein [Candidatus Krumholzibacteria bacterium]|nr:PHP domain-containing protein [Candidatus Krumholzibacteria bacterium]